jgi:hypothetical protein
MVVSGQLNALATSHSTIKPPVPTCICFKFLHILFELRTCINGFYISSLWFQKEKFICWVPRKVVVIYILLTNTRNLLNQTQYATYFGQPWHPQAPCKVVVIYIMPLNTPNLLNLTLFAACFGCPRPFSGTEVHHLQNSSGHAVFCDLWNLRNFISVIIMDYLVLRSLFVLL